MVKEEVLDQYYNHANVNRRAMEKQLDEILPLLIHWE